MGKTTIKLEVGWSALCVIISIVLALVAEIAGMRTHLGAYNHRFDNGYEWFVMPIAIIQISDLQKGMRETANFHVGPHIRFPGFEYVRGYREFRIPWRANVSTFYTLVLPTWLVAAVSHRLRKKFAAP